MESVFKEAIALRQSGQYEQSRRPIYRLLGLMVTKTRSKRRLLTMNQPCQVCYQKKSVSMRCLSEGRC